MGESSTQGPIAAFVALAVVVTLAVASQRRSAPAPLALARPAMAYHVEYAVTRDTTRATESLWVHRPFESEQVLTGGGATTRTVSRLGRQLLLSGGAPAVFEVGPQMPQFDQRVDAVASILHAGATRKVAGRTCRVVRTRDVLAADTAGKPTSSDHVDSCITSDDIVVSETTVRGGHTVAQKVATRVEVGAAAATHAFKTTGDHVGRAQGGGRILTMANDNRPPGQDFWELASPPAGFTHLGRFAVISPSTGTGGVVTSVDDVYVHDADFIVVEQGETVSGTAMAAPAGTSVALGKLGKGKLHASPVGSSVSALTPVTGSFVRVTGSVAPTRLVSIARALRPQPGGTGPIVTIADATNGGDA